MNDRPLYLAVAGVVVFAVAFSMGICAAIACAERSVLREKYG